MPVEKSRVIDIPEGATTTLPSACRNIAVTVPAGMPPFWNVGSSVPDCAHVLVAPPQRYAKHKLRRARRRHDFGGENDAIQYSLGCTARITRGCSSTVRDEDSFHFG